MPVGEERLISPITLSDGTLLFMYYKYPLRQAFGGVLAEPIVVLHEGGEYRVRYESRDGEGRDRLEGARPIVTRDWKRSKWLNEFLVGLDELRLMASLGGRGGPENELYRILSDSQYRQHLACYASKFPDESGSRLIVLNWVGPPAETVAAEVVPIGDQPAPVIPLAHQNRTRKAAAPPPAAPRASVAPAAPQQAYAEPPSRHQPSAVVPLAHQVSSNLPAPPPEATRQIDPPEAAPPAPEQVSVEDAGTRKLKLGLDSTQPVPVQSPTAPLPDDMPDDMPETAQQPTAGPPAAPEGEYEPAVTPRTRVDLPATELPSTVVPLAHQVSTDPPAPIPIAHRAAAAPASVEYERSILPSSAVRRAGVTPRPPSLDRRRAADAGRRSSLPPSWMIAGVILFGFSLLLAGWWLRGASEQPTIALSSPVTEAEGAALASTGIAGLEPVRQDPPAQDSLIPDAGTGGAVVSGDVTSGDAAPQRDVRQEPEEVVRSSVPASRPDPQPSPPAPVAIETPLLAQGSAAAESPPPAAVQDWGGEVPDEPSVGAAVVAQETRPPVVAVAPPPAPAPAEKIVPTLKITSAQMSAAQRSYLSRVIKFLEPPLKYEWTPKYTRPAFFASLVTDGEPPECRIDFKEPTSISFDLVIRGGSGTESRIEDVEIIY